MIGIEFERNDRMKKLIAILATLTLILAACGGDSDGGDDGGSNSGGSSGFVGDAAAGEEVYESTCAACHGSDGEGVEGLGKDLHDNEFLSGMSDDEFVDFLEEGRPAGDPLNDTGIDMPPKGGNTSLSEQDLYDVAAYVRTLD